MKHLHILENPQGEFTLNESYDGTKGFLVNSIVRGHVYPMWWYLFIAGNSLLYLVLGLFVFGKIEKKARRLNKMGQY